VADDVKHGTVPDDGAELPPEWQAAHDLAVSGAERIFIEELARRAAGWLGMPVVGHEAENGIPIDFAWPDARIAVCLNLEPGERRDLESAGWRVFPYDPDAVVAALREAA